MKCLCNSTFCLTLLILICLERITANNSIYKMFTYHERDTHVSRAWYAQNSGVIRAYHARDTWTVFICKRCNVGVLMQYSKYFITHRQLIIKDFHTHNLYKKNAIINVPKEWLLQPEKFSPQNEAVYSVGIHPWWTTDYASTMQMLAHLPLLLKHPQVVAVGECGIDRMRGANIDFQTSIFVKQVALAESLRLPITLHIVRSFDILLRLNKQLCPTTQWTVHGFRGRPTLAQQLLNAGINLSFGTHYNIESWEITPPDRRHRETDDE